MSDKPKIYDLELERSLLLDESIQLMKIFGAILRNTRSSETDSR